MTRLTFLLLLLSGIASCNIQDKGNTLDRDAFSAFYLLDSTQAAEVIIQDSMDHFFDKITPIDMGIQLHASIKGESREELLMAYKKGLQEEVTNFTKEEYAFVYAIMVKALKMCSDFNKKIIPNKINLIKVKGTQYGNGVFYTRNRSIIIPANELEDKNGAKLMSVLLHELSHIMTRYHPTLKDSLYATIGFHRLPFDKPWSNQDSITSRFLTNPDGAGQDYTITLHTQSGEEVEVMPVIRSNYADYSPEKPEFFNYFGFQLFPIIETATHKEFGVKPDNMSLYAINEYTDFFTQIKGNTDYIIHPDEIIADNFMILLFSTNKQEGFELQQYSLEGQALIKRLMEILGNYNGES